MANEDVARFQVEVTKAKLDELEEFRRAGGLKSKRELFDVAFTLLKWAAKKRAQGAAIGSFTEDGGFREYELTFLEDYATFHKQDADNPFGLRDGRSAASVPGKVATKSAGASNFTKAKAANEKRRRIA